MLIMTDMTSCTSGMEKHINLCTRQRMKFVMYRRYRWRFSRRYTIVTNLRVENGSASPTWQKCRGPQVWVTNISVRSQKGLKSRTVHIHHTCVQTQKKNWLSLNGVEENVAKLRKTTAEMLKTHALSSDAYVHLGSGVARQELHLIE